MTAKPWERCQEHGEAQPRVWACPSCLVELREENRRLRAKLVQAAVTAGAAADAGLNGLEIAALIDETKP